MTTKHTTAEKDEKLAAETKSEARAAAVEEKLAEKAAAKEGALAAEAAAAPPAEEAPAVASNDLAAASAPEKVPDVEKFGNPDTLWQVVARASSEEEGWRKVTRRMALHPGGAIYQTETQQRNPDGSYALSQATVFVPA